jgi:hypothetical protein
MRLVRGAVVALALAGCGGTETVTVTQSQTLTETETAVETVTQTETVSEPSGLPAAVAETHSALLSAAGSGRYRELRPLIPEEFSYTFGGPAPGGPIAYWRRVERQSGERPIEILARILELPYTLSAGTYVWPFAYDKAEDELTPYERELLGDLAVYSGAGSGYLGWRTGIEPDGTWRFFIAGD